MAAGDCKIAYGASSALTQTNLDALASSATWVGVWESAAIDNSSNLYEDYLISGVIKVESASITAGQIRVGIVAELEDSTWPDVFDGTESTETITSTSIRDQVWKLGAVIANDTTNSALYYFEFTVAALFGGVCPRKFVVVIGQSSGQNLESTDDPNKVYIKGVYHTVALS